jgi:hypothetical protein
LWSEDWVRPQYREPAFSKNPCKLGCWLASGEFRGDPIVGPQRTLCTMVKELAGPDLIVMAGLFTLAAFGVLTPRETFEGFANPALTAVGALFIVSAAMRDTGALEATIGRLPVHRLRARGPPAQRGLCGDRDRADSGLLALLKQPHPLYLRAAAAAEPIAAEIPRGVNFLVTVPAPGALPG